MTTLLSGNGTCWMPDGSGTMQQVVFRSTAEQRTCWKAAWLAMAGRDTDHRGNTSDPPVDSDVFPGRAGTYEYIGSFLSQLRA
jgi:hypothetical protein